MYWIVPEEKRMETFNSIYERVYGEPNEVYLPPIVILELDDKTHQILALYAGGLHDVATFYLEHAMKTVTQKEYPHDSAVHFYEAIMFIQKTFQIRYITCLIERTNLPPLIRCLKSGFIIQGTKVNPAGIFYVGMILDTYQWMQGDNNGS